MGSAQITKFAGARAAARMMSPYLKNNAISFAALGLGGVATSAAIANSKRDGVNAGNFLVGAAGTTAMVLGGRGAGLGRMFTGAGQRGIASKFRGMGAELRQMGHGRAANAMNALGRGFGTAASRGYNTSHPALAGAMSRLRGMRAKGATSTNAMNISGSRSMGGPRGNWNTRSSGYNSSSQARMNRILTGKPGLNTNFSKTPPLPSLSEMLGSGGLPSSLALGSSLSTGVKDVSAITNNVPMFGYSRPFPNGANLVR